MTYIEWLAAAGGLSAGYTMAHHAEHRLAWATRGPVSRMSPAEAFDTLERHYPRGPLLDEAWARWLRQRASSP